MASESLSDEGQERAAISVKYDLTCRKICVVATPDFGSDRMHGHLDDNGASWTAPLAALRCDCRVHAIVYRQNLLRVDRNYKQQLQQRSERKLEK